MGTYDTRDGAPISLDVAEPEIHPLEDEVLGILEAAGVPTAVNDKVVEALDRFLAARSETASRDAIIEECARVCDLLAGLNVQGWGRKSTVAARKCAVEIRALKNAAPASAGGPGYLGDVNGPGCDPDTP